MKAQDQFKEAGEEVLSEVRRKCDLKGADLDSLVDFWVNTLVKAEKPIFQKLSGTQLKKGRPPKNVRAVVRTTDQTLFEIKVEDTDAKIKAALNINT